MKARTALLALAFTGAATAQVTTQHWVTPGDGMYDDVTNWTSVVPDANDNIIFDHNLSYTVTVPGGFNRRIIDMHVPQGDVTLDLGGVLYTILGGLTVAGNPGETATLTITNGRVTNTDCNINVCLNLAEADGADATLNIVGANTEVDMRGVISSGSSLGWGGTRTVNVLDGATMKGLVFVSADLTNTATLNIDGDGSVWENSQIGIGNRATGHVTVSNGARIEAGSQGLTLGTPTSPGQYDGIGILDVSGPGSSVTGTSIYSRLTIAGSGTGSILNISDQAVAEFPQIIFYQEEIATGPRLNLYSGARVDSPDIQMRERARLHIDGGYLNAWEPGTDPVSGAPIRVGKIDFDWRSNIDLRAGRLEADVISCCGNFISNLGTLYMDAGELSFNQYRGNLSFLGGTIDPGDPVRIAQVNGNYTQPAAGTLRVDINGTIPGTGHDQLAIDDIATLDGELEVILDPAFTVSAGQSFDFLTADVISGGFTSIDNFCISDTLYWTVTYDIDPAGMDTASLEVAQAPSGTICSGGVTVVGMDVDPWTAANEVRPDSTDSIVIAVLGSNTASGDPINFDVQQIDQDTLRFGPDGAEIISLEPLFGDYDSDSNQDAAFVFSTPDTGIACGDTDATVTGETFAGELFEGTSAIVTTECTTCHP